MTAVRQASKAQVAEGAGARLTVAVPAKGRMAEPALRLFQEAGLSFEASERSLVVPCANAPVDLLLVRTDDIPEYVQDGVVDLGVTGANLVLETGAAVTQLLELGFGRCALAVAVPEQAEISTVEDVAGLRVATSYPVSARALLAERGVRADIVTLSGSVEAAPRLGLADAIVDLVSTGSTLRANGLRRLDDLLRSEAVLIGNETALVEKAGVVDSLRLMVEGVVAGRRLRYVMMNATTEALPQISAVLPSLGAPTVLPLAEDGAIAVHAAVDVDDVWSVLPALKSAGATSILVVPVERLVR